MPARYPQVPDKIVPPQRFSYVFQTFFARFVEVFFALSGDTDQRFPNVFDVGGFPKRAIKQMLSTLFVS